MSRSPNFCENLTTKYIAEAVRKVQQAAPFKHQKDKIGLGADTAMLTMNWQIYEGPPKSLKEDFFHENDDEFY